MKTKLFFLCILVQSALFAQQNKVTVINDVTIHTGNGTVIEHGTIMIKNGRLDYVGELKTSFGESAVDLVVHPAGSHVYPGLIAVNAQIGLKEIEQARATLDFNEVGNYNPNIRSVVAYNTDSKVIPTVRSNGILLAQVMPAGGVINGQSSVVKLSGWNWEDAAVKTDIAMHINWPAVYSYDYPSGRYISNAKYADEVNGIRQFLNEAKAYCAVETHATKNLRFEAMRNLLAGRQPLFVKAYYAKEMISAVDLAKEFNIKLVLISGAQVAHVTDLLKENNIPVVLESTFLLPSTEDEDVDMPYKLPALLQEKGILFGLTVSNEGSSYWNVRNLPFAAGIAAANGLTKEQALSSVTWNNAKILGIEQDYGTLETGKSATLFISDGDMLDMQTSRISSVFINGEEVDVKNWQNDLYEKYSGKYGTEIK